MRTPLRLRAVVPGDYDVFAACIQDALMPVREMTFRRRERRFISVFDRFMWERVGTAGGSPRLVVQSALRFEGVSETRLRAVDRASGGLLQLLTVVPEPGTVSLMFAGGGAIRLEGEAIAACLEDIAPPRPASLAPSHEDAAP